MNERILELAEEAGLKVESWMTNPPKPFQILGSVEQFEMFTQLIVLECIDIVDETSGSNKLLRPDPYHQIVSNIEDHFGVE